MGCRLEREQLSEGKGIFSWHGQGGAKEPALEMTLKWHETMHKPWKEHHLR